MNSITQNQTQAMNRTALCGDSIIYKLTDVLRVEGETYSCKVKELKIHFRQSGNNSLIDFNFTIAKGE
jgi:hypothetical protein